MNKTYTAGAYALGLMLVSGMALAQDDLDSLFGTGAQTESSSQDSEASQSSDESEAEPAVAAELPESEPPKVEAPPRRATLEEIVVTAQKREQGLSDVPVSISAISGEKMADAGIEDLIDLSEYTPNFKLVEGGLVPLVYMRGVGSGSNQGFEMSVGMYNDGIHFGRPFQSLAAFLDVERVEVLKGPQSILFGKNAIAGALNITSGKPQEDFDSQINLSWFEPNSDGEGSGFITGSLTDNVQGRLAFRARTEGGMSTT